MKKLYFLFAVVLFCMSGKAQIINFPDSILKAKLLQTDSWSAEILDQNGIEILIDANQNGEIEVSEAQNVRYLTLGSNPTNEQNYITDATGLEMFTNLTNLRISWSNLTTLNIPGLSQLTSLTCTYSELASANLSQMPNLKNVFLGNNYFTSINAVNFQGTNQIELLRMDSCLIMGNVDLTGFTVLKSCSFDYNEINNINVTGLINLEEITIQNNNLSSIELSSLPNFRYLNATANLITSLDVSQNVLLTHLYLSNNLLATLDLSQNIQFFYLNIKNNNLVTLFIKNGHSDTIQLNNNPNLAYICGDEADLSNTMLTVNPLTQVNSYCSFVPGGIFYTVEGSNSYDGNNDGCSSGDFSIPHIRISVTNGTTSGTLIANNSGDYSIPLLVGSYTLTPSFENSSYFNITPSDLIVSFPADQSPYNQHFCITSNGVHPDVEIIIIPMGIAAPGFDCQYKIIYKNKGNQTQSGSISLAFNDAVLDLINANPTVSSQAINVLNWNFTDLQPFESREITVTLNANSPTEVPPINGADILSFTASVNSLLTDETPGDNTFTLNQTVVNSFDPNDKTCLEGNTITPEMVGKEVHYLIRFENTGTANAENIVVKDMIDTTKFDVNSLVPFDGSHSFVTKISNSNKVEFIFENINLPFDDANNDGYLAFKIKTKPTLVLGDSFSNTASIYFDYNFPIITDPAVTTVALLGNSDFDFEQYFKIYPNPANDVLNIETKQTIAVTSINIYNTLGQLVLVIPNAQQTRSVDVSSLKTGNYFLKINSDKGSSSVKFVKM